MPAPKRVRRGTAFMVALAIVVAIPLTVVAADVFNDVPDSNVHHDDITWLQDNGVTFGCNPPANTEFCPGDAVLRQQMASFMRRLAENRVVDAGTLEGQTAAEIIAAAGGPSGALTGSASSQVTDFNQSILVDTADWEEILSVDADVAGDANVTLAAHVYLERSPTANARYELKLAPESCDGDPLGVAWWRPDTAVAFEATTIALTGFDTVSEPTTYVLCAAKFSAGLPNITAHMRGITANWNPAS